MTESTMMLVVACNACGRDSSSKDSTLEGLAAACQRRLINTGAWFCCRAVQCILSLHSPARQRAQVWRELAPRGIQVYKKTGLVARCFGVAALQPEALQA